MGIDEVVKDRLREAVKALYDVELSEIHTEHPLHETWGDSSSNVAMVSAMALGKAPIDVAKEIVSWLHTNSPDARFEKIEVAGPGFINFTFSLKFYLSQILIILNESSDFGKASLGVGKKVALEHSNVNPNKAAHIGHLRNAVIGQFLERIYEFIGYDVNVQYYSNDLGVQVSTSLLGMRKLAGVMDANKYKKFDHYAWDVYAKISQMLDTDEVLKEELNSLMVKLDARDPILSREQKELSNKILKDNLVTFSRLGIDYDLIVYESSIKDMMMWERAFELLKRNVNVYFSKEGRSKGCWLVKLGDTKGMHDIEEDKIIVRSNGIPTYTGKDIAYHMWKYGLLGIDFRYNVVSFDTQKKPLYETDVQGGSIDTYTNSDIVIDVIDVRQTYAIDAVRKSLEYLGYGEQSDNLIHINYGHVYLSNKTASSLGYSNDADARQLAMSGRKGVGVKIDDFIDMMDSSLKNKFGDFPNSDEIRNSALKFDMLRYDTFQDTVFDIESSLNVKGFTGPYIQYTHARANTLLERVDCSEKLPDGIAILSKVTSSDINESAVELLRSLYRFPEIVLESALKFAPNALCNYLYEICQKFNSFYNDSPVLNEENAQIRDFRIILTASVKQVVSNGLYLLGIKAVDRM